MKRNYVRQVVNIASTLLVLVVNFLANALPLNGKNTGEISDQFDVYFVPAGYVFSIWGLIYVGLIAFTIYQALPSQWDNARLKRIGYLYPLSCLANAAWIFLWHYERFPLTLVAMLILLLALIAIYVRLHIGREAFTFSETWLIRIPFSLYLGWITVATIANVTSLLDFLGWGGWGIAPEIWAVIMLIAATGIASLVSISRGDIPYMLVIIWAFVGIAVKHAATPTVAIAAWVTTGINAAMMVVGALLHRRR
ncbi:MAG: tryptophan-rich sensory protein, partial [Chloroflexi bacterium]|nr:tryptophan-rich sensory protein [Chloroflexota bacterium]